MAIAAAHQTAPSTRANREIHTRVRLAAVAAGDRIGIRDYYWMKG
jgi:hypothetical protein